MSLVRRIGTILLAGLMLGQAACSREPTAEEDKVVGIIANGTSVHGRFAPGGLTGVVHSDGWLAQQLATRGYKIEFIDMPHAIGGPMINEGFANHSLEFAFYGDLPAVIGASGGAPIRLVLSLAGNTNTYVLVAPNSSARSIVDLKGKRIALHRGRPWEPAFARLVESAGLKIADFKIINVNPSAGASALAAGKLDAFVGPIADADRLVSQNAGRILWSTKQAPPAWAARTEIFGRKDFVAAHPDIATLVAAAYLRAAKWAAQPQNRDAYIKRLSVETPERAIRADLDGSGDWAGRFAPSSTAMLQDHYQYVIDYSLRSGLIGQKPDLADLTDAGLTPTSLKLAETSAAAPTDPADAR